MAALGCGPLGGKEAQGVRTAESEGAQTGEVSRDWTLWALKAGEGVHSLS